MSSAAGGYGGGAGGGLGTEPHHHDGHAALGHLFRHYHAQHAAAEAAGQLCHVPQHSRREKLRFPPEGAADSPTPPPALAPQHMPGAWPPPAFYSYASSSSSYSPHSPTLPQGQLVAHGLTEQQLQQISTQNFSLSLSSASSNLPPTPRRHTGGPVLGTGPYGPFTGYAAVLGRSRFLAPAQKLLEEICDVGGAAAHVDRSVPDEGVLDADPIDGADTSLDHELDSARADAGPISGAEQQWKKTKLISMMEEVCKRYRQYYQQIQAVIASFETVAGFSNAAPFAAVALRAMAKHFRCLKGMILKQLRNTSSKVAAKEGVSKDMVVFGLSGGGGGGFPIGDVNLSYGQPHNIWRPQRGLPERAVAVLRAWLFDNFLHPYPSDGDKQMLAKQTGLTRNQVSNWFINARVRLWKPMVEEIHNLEMRQIHKHSVLDKGQHGIHHQTQHSSQRSGKRSEPCDSQPGQSSSITRNHNAPASQQGFPDELSQMSHSIQGQVSLAYNALASQHSMASRSPHHHQQAMAGFGGAGAGSGGGGVSLTLGLHQNNNRVCFAEPLPQAALSPTLPPPQLQATPPLPNTVASPPAPPPTTPRGDAACSATPPPRPTPVRVTPALTTTTWLRATQRLPRAGDDSASGGTPPPPPSYLFFDSSGPIPCHIVLLILQRVARAHLRQSAATSSGDDPGQMFRNLQEQCLSDDLMQWRS